MFQYQIDSMRKSIQKLLNRKNPPESVGIKLKHAEFLGVGYTQSPPINEKKNDMVIAGGVLYGSVVMVKLYDLYLALKGATGVDAEDYEQSRSRREQKQETDDRDREVKTPDADHSQANQESEGADGD